MSVKRHKYIIFFFKMYNILMILAGVFISKKNDIPVIPQSSQSGSLCPVLSCPPCELPKAELIC